MAYREPPREAFVSVVRADAVSDAAFRASEATRRARAAELLAKAHDRMASGVRSRPEDSSPAIRKLLGRDKPERPPRRWEARTGIRSDGSVGPVMVELADRPLGASDRR